MEVVTVITPTILGREHLLEECKESVLSQTYPEVAHEIFLDKESCGPAHARNKAVENSESEWISFLDDDDIMFPEHIEKHMEFLNDADVIFTWGMAIHPDGGEALFDSSYNRDRIMSGRNTIPVTATVRRSVFEAVGGFSETERFEDWALWRDLIRAGANFHCIEEVTWHYRMGLGTQRNEKE